MAKLQELNATIQMEECLKYSLCAVELSIAHGELAIQIWQDIPKKYKYIYVACDTYFSVSIKSFERKERGESNKFLIKKWES